MATTTNDAIAALPSGTRTTAQNLEFENQNHKGCHVIIDVTSINAVTPILTPTIQGYNKAADSWYTILTGAAIATVSTVVLRVYPGITAAANLAVSDFLPEKWRLNIAVADTDAATYSVGVNLEV